MGNWRTVEIIGSCPEEDVRGLREFIDCADMFHSPYKTQQEDAEERWSCMCYPGPSVCGLGIWANAEIHRIGNLAERDFSVEDVRHALEKIGKYFSGLELSVHCGGDYESLNCVATVKLKDGVAKILPAEKEKIEKMSGAQLKTNLLRTMLGLDI